MDVRSIEDVEPAVEHNGTVPVWWLVSSREMKDITDGGYLELVSEFEVAGGGLVDPHAHPTHEFYYVTSGRGIMTIEDEHWRLARGPKVHRMRPAVDPLFASAAEARGSRVVGVLLSGGGVDGVEGLIAIKGKGGLSIVQRPDEARQPSMPLTAIREDDVNAALRADEIAEMIVLLAAGRPYTTRRR